MPRALCTQEASRLARGKENMSGVPCIVLCTCPNRSVWRCAAVVCMHDMTNLSEAIDCASARATPEHRTSPSRKPFATLCGLYL